MCQEKPRSEAQSLHEKICQATHGIPCKAVHAVGNVVNVILGREPKKGACTGPGQRTTCDCKNDQS